MPFAADRSKATVLANQYDLVTGSVSDASP